MINSPSNKNLNDDFSSHDKLDANFMKEEWFVRKEHTGHLHDIESDYTNGALEA
jgi:hypothetical protein